MRVRIDKEELQEYLLKITEYNNNLKLEVDKLEELSNMNDEIEEIYMRVNYLINQLKLVEIKINALIFDNDDILMQQLNDLREFGLFNYSYIPTIVLYEHYKLWLKENNIQLSPLNKIEYSRQISKRLKSFGYDKTKQQRIRSIKKSEFNFNIINFLDIDLNSDDKTTICIKSNIDSNDILLKQLRELEDFGLFNYSHIPVIFLYEHYKLWLRENNPGSQPMKKTEYSRQINKKLSVLGYIEFKRQKVKYIKKEQFDFSMFNEFNLNIDTESLSETIVFINSDLDIKSI